MSEDELQRSFVKYLSLKYPTIRYCASLGGIRTTYKQAVKAKANGYIKGMPDIQVMEARGGCHGLFIELKYKGYATKEQKEWIKDLQHQGYEAVVAKGIDQACETLDVYMSKDKTKVCGCETN